MNSSTTYIDNQSTHAWLRSFEYREKIVIGEQPKFWPIHLRQQVGFNSEPRAKLADRQENQVPELIWNDFGLFSPTGPLPEIFMERVLHSTNGKYLLQFIDGLIQRLSHLHYRAWAANRPECDSNQRTNGFTSFIQALSDANVSEYPHLVWLKPLPQMLPSIAKNKLKLELHLEQIPVQKITNETPIKLGCGRLGHEILGTHLHMYTIPLRRFKVSVNPSTEKMFKELRDQDSLTRKKLNALIKVCITAPQKAEVYIQPVEVITKSRMGNIQLGRSQLFTGSRMQEHNIQSEES